MRFYSICFSLFLLVCCQTHRNVAELLLSAPDEEVVVLECDKPWENHINYVSILNTGKGYIMYYRTLQKQRAPWMVYCIAKSKDGIHWEKPILNTVSFGGNTYNNIVSDRFNGISATFDGTTYYWLSDRIYNKKTNRFVI